MDSKYIDLFQQIARGMELTAERSMDDELHRESGQKMRDAYAALKDKLIGGEALTYIDYTNLYLGAELLSRQIDANIATWRKVSHAYKEKLIPALSEVVDAKDKFWVVAEEKFKSDN